MPQYTKTKQYSEKKQTNENLNVKYNFPSLSYYILQEINAYSVDLEKMNKPAMYVYVFLMSTISQPQKGQLS